MYWLHGLPTLYADFPLISIWELTIQREERCGKNWSYPAKLNTSWNDYAPWPTAMDVVCVKRSLASKGLSVVEKSQTETLDRGPFVQGPMQCISLHTYLHIYRPTLIDSKPMNVIKSMYHHGLKTGQRFLYFDPCLNACLTWMLLLAKADDGWPTSCVCLSWWWFNGQSVGQYIHDVVTIFGLVLHY